MAFNDIDRKRAERLVGAFVEKRRPPPHIRPQLDLGFRVQGQSVEIFEIRPGWRVREEKMEHPVARTTFIKTQKIWKIYWQRADLKWHTYSPAPEVDSLEEFLSLVEKDEHACFFG